MRSRATCIPICLSLAVLLLCAGSALAQSGIRENASSVGPTFAISATNVNLVDGADTGNVSTITVTPANGFTGSVALTAAVTSAPANSAPLPPPTFSFGTTSPVVISGATAKAGSMTITTTPFYWPSCTKTGAVSFAVGGVALACLLFFGVPARNRAWRGMLLLMLLAAFSTGILACGGNGHTGCAIPALVRGGTAPGSYTITVTGTSGSTTATGTLILTVAGNRPSGA